VQFIPWRRESLRAFVPFEHALAARRQIDLRELAGEALVAVSSEAAPAFSAFVREACGQAGFRPRIVLESHRAQAVAVMVAAGTGIALLPSSLARIVGGAAADIPIKKAPTFAHVFARTIGKPSPAMRHFVALLTARP
jgi:DNA-binding transcriptional LysR family regulator